MRFHYWLVRFLLFVGTVILFRFRVYRKAIIPKDCALIFASNHASGFDPPILSMACTRELGFFAKRELFAFKPFGWLIKAYGAFPVDRNQLAPSTMRILMERLQSKHAIVMFPEGTRSKTAEMLPAKPGVGYVAFKAGVPVVVLPVYIHGSRTLKVWKLWFNNLYAVTGEPIKLSDYPDITDNKQGYQQFANIIMNEIKALAKHPIKTA